MIDDLTRIHQQTGEDLKGDPVFALMSAAFDFSYAPDRLAAAFRERLERAAAQWAAAYVKRIDDPDVHSQFFEATAKKIAACNKAMADLNAAICAHVNASPEP